MKNISKKILYSGIILWLVGIIVVFLNPQESQFLENSRIYELAINHFILFVLVVVAAPLFEEMVFRFGLVYSKPYTYYFYGIIGLYVLVISTWQLLAIVILLSAIVHCLKLKSSIKIILVSSIAFAAVHVTNFSQYNFFILFYLMAIFGPGLILSYIRIKRGILLAIACHALYNFSVLYADYLSNPKQIIYEDHTVELKLERNGFLSSQLPSFYFEKGSIKFTSKNIEHLMKHATSRNFNEFHYYPRSVYYDGQILHKDSIETVLPHYLGYEAVKSAKIKQGYVLELGDSIAVETKSNKNEPFRSITKNTHKGVLNSLSHDYKIPIEFANDQHPALTNPKHFTVGYDLEESFEKNIDLIASQIGYEIKITEKEIACNIVTYNKIK